ncbi:related to SPT3 - general transcriptional adaptor or co-activator [Melanopsichium pennsylvanicum]|uniref:Related to SPT3 - general transcriptional adaptor or co-activator n=2 Tax=Melanopsichium pennsylvanicum TaxID=63383 RepID=A0AAJ5C2D6_9BASI|nr:related to SPT3-general transcriptional adaptor or co-activator [Melanopsichium pennsylvanicum 4]SNX81421.1 related to SPT3 - general transcriptional adaptor or co-activator [Melanopsichium pennsylvanicum]
MSKQPPLPSSSSFPGPGMADADTSDAPAPEYRYQVEISQMMFVFADVVDPAPEVTKLVEDIVRSQTIEMIIQSRRLAQRRASKYLSPEDLIFLIRYDRAKVNRLRTYLSWKDVRKNAKDSGDSAGAPGGASEMDALDDATTMDGPGGVKATKMKIRLPWEISSIYSEHVLALPNADGDEEEDDDDLEAHEASMQRLKDADEATRRMTREEYVHYSECRQASFTFRKSKKFREFINSNAYLDVKPNDDIIDILGFLAFEVVRELCVGAVAIKKGLEEQEVARVKADEQKQQGQVSTLSSTLNSVSSLSSSSLPASGKRKFDVTKHVSDVGEGSGQKKPKIVCASDVVDVDQSATTAIDRKLTSPIKADADSEAQETETTKPTDDELCALFTFPPTLETPLLASHIQEAFARLQRKHPPALTTGLRGSTGQGGLRRTRVFVI